MKHSQMHSNKSRKHVDLRQSVGWKLGKAYSQIDSANLLLQNAKLVDWQKQRPHDLIEVNMRGVKKLIRAVSDEVGNEIAGTAQGGFYAAGLSAEGYAGGYRDALHDVLVLMNGVLPNRGGRSWWEKACSKIEARKQEK
jgi:hypothetical protein